MNRLLFVLLFIFSISAEADDAIYIGHISDHLYESIHVKRESHPLVIYETDDNVLYGYWRNSFNKNTFVYGKKNDYRHDEFFGHKYNIGYKIGLASGYQVPVFFSFYVQTKWIDVNWLPGELMGIGLRINY